MKRSEMIEKMNEALWDKTQLNMYERTEVIEVLLELFEQARMLPIVEVTVE